MLLWGKIELQSDFNAAFTSSVHLMSSYSIGAYLRSANQREEVISGWSKTLLGKMI